MSQTIDIVYRGPFQGRRVRFVLDALDALGSPQRLFWLNPDPTDGGAAKSFTDFADGRPAVSRAMELDGRARALPATVRALRDATRERSALVVALGFTSLYTARLVRGEQLLWCINGIPEERLLYHDTLRHRVTVNSLWAAARVGRRPETVLTVSRPMADLVRNRIGDTRLLVVPTVVDRAVFRPRPDGPGRMTYMGSGAPWQDLPLLADVWACLHALDPELRFKVITKDPRADILRRGLPADVIEYAEARGPDAVADALRESELGFVVRRPHLVNEVSYPTKFGEYVASGVGVVTTDIGWDIGDLVRSTGCGVLLDVTESPEHMAARIAEAVTATRMAPGPLVEACDQAASMLDRERWVKELGTTLAGVLG
jgi:glycosyltransferase involved in cell wall biosynthesis